MRNDTEVTNMLAKFDSVNIAEADEETPQNLAVSAVKDALRWACNQGMPDHLVTAWLPDTPALAGQPPVPGAPTPL